jgi:PAS domain S-box-containing protein
VEQRFYNRMLLRLLGLPIIALAVLAVLLGSGLQQVEMSARRMDHSDRILAQADLVFRLMIDEETGIRGFLLTHDPIFLQPLRQADKDLDPALEKLVDLVRAHAGQVDRLRELQTEHERWEIESEREITDPPSPSDMEAQLLDRRRTMNAMRSEMTEFISREQQVRDERAAVFSRTGHRTGTYLALLIALIALIIAYLTQRAFIRLARVHRRQVNEIRATSRISFEREQWLNTTLRSIGDAVIACDEQGRVVFVNPIAEQIAGWKEHDAKGRLISDVFPVFDPDTKLAIENPVDEVRRTGTMVGTEDLSLLIRRDGKEIPLDSSGAPIRNSIGDLIGVVMVFRDITERKVSTDALMRAEKLAAAGRLAASVAHEVNNPLEGLTNLVYIAHSSDDLFEIRQLLTQAQQELGRIAHITRQSLGFYREVTAKTCYNPASIVRDAAEFYRMRAASQGVSLDIACDANIEIVGVAGEIRQVISNLLANSLDASTAGAKIRVRARSSVDPRDPRHTGIRISIADSGSGISPKHLPTIFEPFFTTKKDTGTGLGLWVSRQLIEKNGGTLRVRSCVGGARSGTTFSVFLPSAELHPEQAGEATQPQAEDAHAYPLHPPASATALAAAEEQARGGSVRSPPLPAASTNQAL